MSRNTIGIAAPPEAVLAVLGDARRYAKWVVGAKRIRRADPDWPAPGSRFQHTSGVGPLTVDDDTTVVDARGAAATGERDEPGTILLEARALPVGVAEVRITVEPVDAGHSQVTMSERPVGGLAARVHNPLLDALLHVRNTKSLRRLRRLVEQHPGA